MSGLTKLFINPLMLTDQYSNIGKSRITTGRVVKSFRGNYHCRTGTKSNILTFFGFIFFLNIGYKNFLKNTIFYIKSFISLE